MSKLKIRRTQSADDWRAVRELCARTGNGGSPIERERWEFFGEHWVGPYQRFLPEWTYLADVGGVTVGYLTGCPDTKSFRLRKALFFKPRLIWAIWRGRYPKNADARRFLRRTFRLERGPEQAFARKLRNLVEQEYPAHLHINFEATCRGKGMGRALTEAFYADLRGRRVPGVHVYCGADPVPFYRRLGFEELGKAPWGKGEVHLLGAKL
jgi:GNAT superfamily N-acetyltransferase